MILWLNEKRREEKKANFVLMLVNFLFKYGPRLGDGKHVAATGKPGSQSEKISNLLSSRQGTCQVQIPLSLIMCAQFHPHARDVR